MGIALKPRRVIGSSVCGCLLSRALLASPLAELLPANVAAPGGLCSVFAPLAAWGRPCRAASFLVVPPGAGGSTVEQQEPGVRCHRGPRLSLGALGPPGVSQGGLCRPTESCAAVSVLWWRGLGLHPFSCLCGAHPACGKVFRQQITVSCHWYPASWAFPILLKVGAYDALAKTK